LNSDNSKKKPPTLELRHFQMIAVLAATPRVTDAAECLGITPSSLSHRIREAERRRDLALFTRVHKRLRMTPAGAYLAQVAERTLADLARAEEDARRMDRGFRQVVRFAVESYSSYHWLPAFLRHLRAREAEVGLQVVAAATRAGDGAADRTTWRVGEFLAEWCASTGGFGMQGKGQG